MFVQVLDSYVSQRCCIYDILYKWTVLGSVLLRDQGCGLCVKGRPCVKCVLTICTTYVRERVSFHLKYGSGESTQTSCGLPITPTTRNLGYWSRRLGVTDEVQWTSNNLRARRKLMVPPIKSTTASTPPKANLAD